MFFYFDGLEQKKWNINDTVQQLIDTLKWRISFNIKNILKQGESILNQEELQLGKTIIIGTDYYQRTVTYIQVSKHIKGKFSIESTQLLTIFTVETARKLLKNGNETATVIIDLDGFLYRNLDYDFVKLLISLLENHYSESLALVINTPYLFNICWNIIKYWLDPVVQSKIIFFKNYNDLVNYIDISIIPKQLNGQSIIFKYIPPTKQDK
jgi:hypothetical protein